jgi:hypothetical protein
MMNAMKALLRWSVKLAVKKRPGDASTRNKMQFKLTMSL